MYKYFFAVFLVFLLTVQSFVPINQALAVDGLSINATVGGQQSLEIGRDGKVTTTVTFDLLPGGTATAKQRKPMDVVIVFDKSGSMAEEVGGGKTKLQLAKEAVQKAVNTFKANNINNSDRYGIVSFDSNVNYDYTINTLQSDPDRIMDKIKYAPAQGGTNYTDALIIAQNILKNSTNRSNRDQYIIFMTDGKPTNSTKQVYVNKRYYKLEEYYKYQWGRNWSGDSYYRESRYDEWRYYGGGIVYVDSTPYIISENRTTITGTKTHLYDSNNGRNNIVIEHNGGYYIDSYNNDSVPNVIKAHGLEQAQNIENNNMTLLSIGFGEQNKLDMNYLAELSSISDGKAERATPENIVKMFEDISKNISAEYPSLSNGFIRFKIPFGAMVQENDAVSVVDDTVIMNLRDIKYNPNPPNAGDSSLRYELPVTFTAPGVYNFSFDVLYNSGTIARRGIPYSIEVKVPTIPLSSISFIEKEKTIHIGERFKVEDYLRFVPSDATNKLIGNVSTNNSSPIIITKVGNEWYVTARDIGYATIEATADEDSTIKDSMRVIVSTRNTDSNDGGDSGDDDQDQDDGSDYDDDPETGGDSGDTELKW